MPQRNVDLIAGKLLEWGRLAKRMPPSWDGACISQPIQGPEGERIGRMLPGKGLYLDHDLKSLGILRHQQAMARAGVYEKTPIRQLAEMLTRARHGADLLAEDVRGAITSYDGIIAARAGGNAEDRTIQKASITTVANQWSSLWQVGGFPAAGTYSATPGVAPNNATTGSLSFGLSTPGSGSKYLLSFGYTSASAINMLLLVDILSMVGSLSASTASAQTIASKALTRYTTGAGVMLTAEVTTAIGTTASNVTYTYTNQAGATGKTTTAEAMTTSMIVSRLLHVNSNPIVPLASGDYGVQQVTTVTMSAAMTAGVFGLNLYYPFMFIPGIVANIYIERDSTIQIDGLNQILIGTDSAIGCLGAYVQTNSTSTGILIGSMRTCSG